MGPEEYCLYVNMQLNFVSINHEIYFVKAKNGLIDLKMVYLTLKNGPLDHKSGQKRSI